MATPPPPRLHASPPSTLLSRLAAAAAATDIPPLSELQNLFDELSGHRQTLDERKRSLDGAELARREGGSLGMAIGGGAAAAAATAASGVAVVVGMGTGLGKAKAKARAGSEASQGKMSRSGTPKGKPKLGATATASTAATGGSATTAGTLFAQPEEDVKPDHHALLDGINTGSGGGEPKGVPAQVERVRREESVAGPPSSAINGGGTSFALPFSPFAPNLYVLLSTFDDQARIQE